MQANQDRLVLHMFLMGSKVAKNRVDLMVTERERNYGPGAIFDVHVNSLAKERQVLVGIGLPLLSTYGAKEPLSNQILVSTPSGFDTLTYYIRPLIVKMNKA